MSPRHEPPCSGPTDSGIVVAGAPTKAGQKTPWPQLPPDNPGAAVDLEERMAKGVQLRSELFDS